MIDVKKIEAAAKEAIRNASKMYGNIDLERDIAKAIAAAIAEYDKQKSE